MTGTIIILAVIVCAGLLSMLYGERLFSLILAIAAFVFTYSFINSNFANTSNVTVIALAAAVVAVLLSQYAKRLAFFLLGLYAGYFIGQIAAGYVPAQDAYTPWIVIGVCAVVTGILCAHFNRSFIRIGTSFIGGILIGSVVIYVVMNINNLSGSAGLISSAGALSAYITGQVNGQYGLWLLGIALILTIVGTRYQKHHKHR